MKCPNCGQEMVLNRIHTVAESHSMVGDVVGGSFYEVKKNTFSYVHCNSCQLNMEYNDREREVTGEPISNAKIVEKLNIGFKESSNGNLMYKIKGVQNESEQRK